MFELLSFAIIVLLIALIVREVNRADEPMRPWLRR